MSVQASTRKVSGKNLALDLFCAIVYTTVGALSGVPCIAGIAYIVDHDLRASDGAIYLVVFLGVLSALTLMAAICFTIKIGVRLANK